MKHTYLYPLEDDGSGSPEHGELWLWRVARAGAMDLFGSPDVVSAAGEEWALYTRISEALGEAREELHKRFESRDRVCIGRHYMIPHSLCEVAQSRESEASEIVRLVTLWTWDAPELADTILFQLRTTLNRSTGRNGMDSRADLMAFLEANKGRRVVPVWM